MNLYSDNISYVIEEKIKPNIKLIHDMKIRGLKDKYIAQALGISLKSFNEAKERYDVLKDTYDDAMEIFCAELTDIVVLRALGQDGRKDKDGNLLPADEKLAFKLLEKLDPRFSFKGEIKQTVTIENIIKEITNKRNSEIELEEEEGEEE
jgi:hypothetical protein